MSIELTRKDCNEVLADAVVVTTASISALNRDKDFPFIEPIRDFVHKYVIYTNQANSLDSLKELSINIFQLALENQCSSIVLPNLWNGDESKEREVFQTLVNLSHEYECKMILSTKDTSTEFLIPSFLYEDVTKYLNFHYEEETQPDYCAAPVRTGHFEKLKNYIAPDEDMDASVMGLEPEEEIFSSMRPLEETFSEMVLRKIDEAGLKDSEVYKKANVDRKLFSKIRSNKDYMPSKSTAIALGIALELPLEEMENLLKKAGFAFSHSNKADVIVEYFVQEKKYDLSTINRTLYAFNQKLIRS